MRITDTQGVSTQRSSFYNLKGVSQQTRSNEITTHPTVPTVSNLVTVTSADDIGKGYQDIVIKIGRKYIKKK